MRLRRSFFALLLSVAGCLTLSSCAHQAWSVDHEIQRTDKILDAATNEMNSIDEGLTDEERTQAHIIRLAMMLSDATFYTALQPHELAQMILEIARQRHSELMDAYRKTHSLPSAPAAEPKDPDVVDPDTKDKM